MIDIHCHILPGVDDGADSMETALGMARDAANSGVRAIIATPHCLKEGWPENLLSRGLLLKMAQLSRAIEDAGIRLKIYPGMEIFVTEKFPERLQAGRLLPLAGSRYLLVEFYFDESPTYIEEALRLIWAKGLTPLIAHPERYYCVEWDPSLAEKWAREGCILQLNRGSIQGKLGAQAQVCAWELLERGVPHMVASDAHGVQVRRTELKSVMLELGERLSWAYASKLLVENPRHLIQNETLSVDITLPD